MSPAERAREEVRRSLLAANERDELIWALRQLITQAEDKLKFLDAPWDGQLMEAAEHARTVLARVSP